MIASDRESSYGTIYLVTNTVNGMIYIGQTIMTLGQRWKSHCNNPSRGRLKAAILKYDRSAFTMVELGQANDRDALNTLERKFIKQYKATDRTVGYNFESGGSGVPRNAESIRRSTEKNRGRKLSQEHKDKISASKTGVKQSVEHIERMRAAKLSLKLKHTDEARAKMSQALLGRSRPPRSEKYCELQSLNMRRIWAERKLAKQTSQH